MNYRLFVVLSFVVLAFSLVSKNALAEQEDSDHVPGWGYGDHHHIHVGPPGISDRPEYSEHRYKSYKRSKLYELLSNRHSLQELIEYLLQRRSN